jgi:hypothetical protein
VGGLLQLEGSSEQSQADVRGIRADVTEILRLLGGRPSAPPPPGGAVTASATPGTPAESESPRAIPGPGSDKPDPTLRLSRQGPSQRQSAASDRALPATALRSAGRQGLKGSAASVGTKERHHEVCLKGVDLVLVNPTSTASTTLNGNGNMGPTPSILASNHSALGASICAQATMASPEAATHCDMLAKPNGTAVFKSSSVTAAGALEGSSKEELPALSSSKEELPAPCSSSPSSTRPSSPSSTRPPRAGGLPWTSLEEQLAEAVGCWQRRAGGTMTSADPKSSSASDAHG